MGFTLTRTDSSTVKALRTPEKEAADKANHNHMQRLGLNTPIAIGSEKQIKWAKSIANEFLFYAHAWSFTAADIDLFFANRGKYAKFWIDNRCDRAGEGTTRIAIEAELQMIKLTHVASQQAIAAIATMTPAQLAKKIGR